MAAPFEVGVAWRTAVGTTGATVRTRPGVGVATLAAGGSGLDVSRLRGLAGVGVGGRGATGAGAAGATTGAAGSCRGTAGPSAITGTLNGVSVGSTVGGAVVGEGDGAGVWVTVGEAATGNAFAETVDVGATVGRGTAANAASSISTRRKTIVLPSPSR